MKALAPEASASTSSATRAMNYLIFIENRYGVIISQKDPPDNCPGDIAGPEIYEMG